MRYFNHLSSVELEELFYKKPENMSLMSPREILSYGVGALLYFPATRKRFSELLISNKIRGLMSVAICLEDAVAEGALDEAERNLLKELEKTVKRYEDQSDVLEKLPLIFIRPRSAKHLESLLPKLKPYIKILTGFVLPKFGTDNGSMYLRLVQEANQMVEYRKIYGMPILESPEVIQCETRRENLIAIKSLLSEHKDYILNVRIGATDLLGLFGLRRGHEYSVYDIHVVRDCISDIINIFTRASEGYVVSGPVWESFWSEKRILKPRLRETPFKNHYGVDGVHRRVELLNRYIDGLFQEAFLDKFNGIVGKTVIHPSHILPVQAVYCVTHEDYSDACHILSEDDKAVEISSYQNRMNEKKPHTNWAKRICTLGDIYGVLNPKIDHIRLIGD